MQGIIMYLLSCLACLSAIAFAQLEFSEAVTGSVSFPDGTIACIGNLAVFFTCLIRGRLDHENGARDILATNRGPNIREINGSGLTTCDGDNYERAQVVMLSRDTSNSTSIKQFMKYIHHSHGVHSILLKYLPLQCADLLLQYEAVTAKRECPHECTCILLEVKEEKIPFILALRMSGTLKQMSDSVCILPCWNCLTNGCHGCDQGLLQVKQIVEDSDEESPQIHAEESKCIRLQSAVVTAKLCSDQFHECNCNVLRTDEVEIRMMVDRWMPGTVKRLSNSLCLLPSWDCLRRGCHGLLRTEAEPRLQEEESKAAVDRGGTPRWRLTNEGFKAESPDAVCQMLDNCYGFFQEQPDCICIPLCERGKDKWTMLMIRFLRSKEVIVEASDAMQKYIDCSGEIGEISHAIIEENYPPRSLIRPLIVPRLIEVLLNFVLVGWLRLDGLSSSLIARRVVRDHLVDSKGTGFNANAFLTQAQVLCNQRSVCQMLRFRGKFLHVRTLSYIIGSVNLICAIIWCVLMACNGRYGIHSMPPSKPRIVVMLASIGVALVMDFVDLIFTNLIFRERVMVWAVIILQIGYIVSGSVIVAEGMGIGKWAYSVFQALIWVKWGIGSYLLGDRDNRVDSDRFKKGWRRYLDWEYRRGNLMYSSVFMLNAILAGVRGKWEY